MITAASVSAKISVPVSFSFSAASFYPEGTSACLLPQTVALRAMAYESEPAGLPEAADIKAEEPESAQPEPVPARAGVMRLGYVIPDSTAGETFTIPAEWIFG